MNQYKILNIIGQGAFGNAYLARHLTEGKDYVIKKVELTNKNAEQTENIFNEVKLLEEFKHFNIVSYRQSIIEGQQLNIVMEFCSGGDLNQLITEQKEAGGRRLEEKKVIDWSTQIALAIFYMHDKRILHRDLKTPNIFITDDKVKLGDFGISKVLDEKIDLANTTIGTPYYMSPEQYRHKPYSYKSDMWAFGCILYEMCNQKRPFQAYSIHGLAVKVLQANISPVSQNYSKQLRQLIKKMLQKKQKDRPTILQFLQTPIIRRRVISYLKEVHDKLVNQNGDKVLLQGVLYQARKLGITLGVAVAQDSNRKNKPEFSAEKKRQQKQRIKQQLEQQLKKLSDKSKKQKQQLKRLEQDRKNILKGHKKQTEKSMVSSKKFSIPGSASHRSNKDTSGSSQTENKRNSVAITSSSRQEKPKPFRMEEQYDMYDMSYEQDSEQEHDIQIIHEVEEEEQKHEKQEKLAKEPIHHPEKDQKEVKVEKQVKKEEKPQKQISKVETKQYQKQRYTKNSVIAKDIKEPLLKKGDETNRFNQQEIPLPNQQVPIQQAIINLKSSLKINNQKLYTIKNQLSNIDFSISSSDQFNKTVQQPDKLPIMKKKQKNPTHILITDKINQLRQTLQAIVNRQKVQKLINLARVRKTNLTRTQIQKITGSSKIGAFHLANQIIKLDVLLDKVTLYI